MPFTHGSYLKRPQPLPIEICPACVGSLLFMICSSTYKQGVSCHAGFNFSRLRSGSPMLHSGNGNGPAKCTSSIFVILKFKCAHLKNKRYVAASKQANIHTHVRNAVPLVWGSLRLAPINKYASCKCILLCFLCLCTYENSPLLTYLDRQVHSQTNFL